MNTRLFTHLGALLLYVSLLCMAAHSAHAVSAEKVFPGDGNGIVVKGTYVRKGTIAATFHNVLALDKLLSSNAPESQINAILNDQRPLGRGLYVVDLFEIQPIEGWLRNPNRPGKMMVAVLALQESPELMTDSVRSRLKEISKTCHPIVRSEIGKVLG